MDGNRIERLKYPVGPFKMPESVSSEDIAEWLPVIEEFPAILEGVLRPIPEEAYDWIYRPEGWSIRQVVHHCSDSHLNAYVRFKLALTESKPTIRPYFEARWAELPDGNLKDVTPSLTILKAIHFKWHYLMGTMDQEDWNRVYVHPEYGTEFSLKAALANYEWHCRHHLAHIRQAILHEGLF